MSIAVDTHVHMYDCYNFRQFFDSAFKNLSILTPDFKALCLTERSDCNFFSLMTGDGLADVADLYRFEPVPGQSCVKVLNSDDDVLYVFAGTQVATAERLEILSLLSEERIPDGEAADDIIAAVNRAGGVPVLTWALGKWMFKRSKIVQGIVSNASPGRLLIGDTFMRPACFPDPPQMICARKKGMGIVSGSDPLPSPGEERVAGLYASLIDGEFDESDPVGSLRSLLISKSENISSSGSRSSILETFSRRFT